MAAARQNEMNVSITEDATTSLTRVDPGAVVVWEAMEKERSIAPASGGYVPGSSSSLENNSAKSSTKLKTTTTEEPASPIKKSATTIWAPKRMAASMALNCTAEGEGASHFQMKAVILRPRETAPWAQDDGRFR